LDVCGTKIYKHNRQNRVILYDEKSRTSKNINQTSYQILTRMYVDNLFSRVPNNNNNNNLREVMTSNTEDSGNCNRNCAPNIPNSMCVHMVSLPDS